LPLIPGTGCWSALGFCEDFGNGDQFYARAGEVIELPERRAGRPDRGFLEWRLDEVFKAS
jgi:putative restriction endonuclease